MTKKQKSKGYSDITMTIGKFMANYYNVTGGNLNKLSHKNLNQIFPYVEMVEWNQITEEELITGEVVLVTDSRDEISGYINPYIKEDYTIHDNDTTGVQILFSIDDNDRDLLNEIREETLKILNIYELEKLLKLCRDRQDNKIKRIIEKELYFRMKNHDSKDKSKKLEKIRIREIRKEDI